MRLSLGCAALVFAARAGAVQISVPAGAGPGALHASPLAAWDAGAVSASAGPAAAGAVERALELRGLTPQAFAGLDADAAASAVARAEADLRAEAAAESERLPREAAAADPASPEYSILAAKLAQLAGPLSAYVPSDRRASMSELARSAAERLSGEKRAALERRLQAMAAPLLPGRDATAVEAAAADLPRVPAALITPGVVRLRRARASESKALVRPAVASGLAFRARVDAVESRLAAKQWAGRRLYRPVMLAAQSIAEFLGEFARAWITKTEPDRHPYRWSVLKALHRNGDFTGAFGHATYRGDPQILSTLLGDSKDGPDVETLSAALAAQTKRLRGVALTPGLGVSGMSFPQLTAQSHLALLYMDLKLAKEQGVRLLHNTGEGSPFLLLGLLHGDAAEIKKGVIEWNKAQGQLENGGWDEAQVVAVVDRLMKQRDELFAEFTSEDLSRVQIVAQFGGGLNGIRRDDDEGRVDFDKLRAVAEDPYVAMIQFKLKQAAKRGAKVDAKKMDFISLAFRGLLFRKKYKAPEVIADFGSAEALAGVVKATRALTDKPVSLKGGIGDVRDMYAKLQYLRDARALPDHFQVDGAGKEFSPGSGNAPPEANTSLPADQATIALDAMLKKLGARDQVFVDVSGDVLWPIDAVHKLALGADGVCAARGWLGLGLGCVMAKKCDGRSGMGCPKGIASAGTSLTGLMMDPVDVGRQGYKAAANWHKEYHKMLAEAGVTDAWGARHVLGLHNPLSSVQFLDGDGLERPLDRLYTREVVADTLRGVLTPEEVDRYVFGVGPAPDGTIDIGVARGLLRPFAALPARGSGEWRALVAEARRGLDPKGGPGFAGLDLRRFFPSEAADIIHARMPAASQVRDFDSGAILARQDGRLRELKITPEDKATMRVFSGWLADLLGEALGKRVTVDSVQLRAWSQGNKGLSVPEWHVDGGHLAAIVTLKGSGVEYLRDAAAAAAGAGEAFIFSGDDRGEAHAGVRPTLHRSPLGDEDRLLLVLRLSE